MPADRTFPYAPRQAVGISLALLIAAGLLSPLAYWRLGEIGVAVLGAATVAMWFAALLSHVTERLVARVGNSMAVLLAGMTPRMLVPLIFVIAVLAWNHPRVPARSAIYIAPLYFVVLALETYFALRGCQAGQPGPPIVTAPTPTVVARNS